MAKPQAAPGPRPTPKHPAPTDAHENLARTVGVFSQEFPRRDGSKFVAVTEDRVKLFNSLVDAQDGDALSLYLENPTQLLLSVVFSLNTRLKDIESTLISLSSRVDALERRPH